MRLMPSSQGVRKKEACMSLDVLLKPFEIKGTGFRNRIVSTSHAPGFARQ